MRNKPAICYNTTQCCLIYSLLITVITGILTTASNSSIRTDKIQNKTDLIQIQSNYVNQTILSPTKPIKTSTHLSKSRTKRSILQLAGMIRCVSGCDPFSYKSYGCYCGYMGAGIPVDMIDRCCWEHDWCYSHTACHQTLVYFLQYEWRCINPGYAQCGVVPFGSRKEKCSYQLCQCDRAFAKCLSRMPCPNEKPICQSSPIIAIHNIIVG